MEMDFFQSPYTTKNYEPILLRFFLVKGLLMKSPPFPRVFRNSFKQKSYSISKKNLNTYNSFVGSTYLESETYPYIFYFW